LLKEKAEEKYMGESNLLYSVLTTTGGPALKQKIKFHMALNQLTFIEWSIEPE
jgi:hypothetical protein